MNCPICDSRRLSALIRVHDDRYGYPGQYELMQCHACGHVSLADEMSAGQLTELYTKYYPRRSFNVPDRMPQPVPEGALTWLKGERCSAFRWVPPEVRVLDVGCGFGQSLAYHTSRGCDVYGVEADENIRRVAERFGYKVHVGLFDDALYDPESFDYVTLDQVIEHVTDPAATLRGVARILKSGGVAVLSTPNANGWGTRVFGKRWLNWHAPYHRQFFSRRSMRLAAEAAGLEIVGIDTITSSEWLLYQWIHLVTRGAPGKPSWFWSPDKSDRGTVRRTLVAAIRLMHRSGVNHLLTRLFDALGVGDNLVVRLRKK